MVEPSSLHIVIDICSVAWLFLDPAEHDGLGSNNGLLDTGVSENWLVFEVRSEEGDVWLAAAAVDSSRCVVHVDHQVEEVYPLLRAVCLLSVAIDVVVEEISDAVDEGDVQPETTYVHGGLVVR